MPAPRRSTGRPGLLTAGVLLSAAGAVTCLAKAGRFVASAPGSGPAELWSLAMAALGIAGLAAAAGARRSPGPAGLVMGMAGALALVLDLAGLSTAPRMLAGVVLLGAGALTAGSTATPAGGPRPVPAWARVAVGVGLAAHGAVGVLLLPLGLVAPGWAVLFLYLVWGGLLVVALRARERRPLVVSLAPLAAAAVAAATLAVGGSVLGWTA
jgi:hypothetical protein